MTVPRNDTIRAQVGDLLKRLRAGELSDADSAFLDSLPADLFVRELRSRHPFVFQERSIGRKTELGLAKSLEFQLRVPNNGRHLFGSVDLLPILRSCLLLSIYDNRMSGVAVTKSIRLRPADADGSGVVVAMGNGFKLDRLPDGWMAKSFDRKSSVLRETLLKSRGWKFEVLQPFSRMS